MDRIFSQILNMSLTGGAVILVVLLLRLPLRRAPKRYSCVLWLAVLFRLLCPVSLAGPVSLLEYLELEITTLPAGTSTVSFLSASGEDHRTQGQWMPTVPEPGKQAETEEAAIDGMAIAGWVWLAGCGAMVAGGQGQYRRLKKRLQSARHLQDQVYLTEQVGVPFVMGIRRPRIYLPESVRMADRPYILAHERQHIRRLDPLFKLLGYGALCIHWFNPMVWLAFSLAGKDMEMSCDEGVIRTMDPEKRADYAAALLRLSTLAAAPPASPLAFGGGDTKGRIRNMAKWKKPKLWVSILCPALCLVILAVCVWNPAESSQETTLPFLTGETPADDVTLGPLPQGYTGVRRESGGISFLREDTAVGGVDVYPLPMELYDPQDKQFFWLEAAGISDFGDSSLYYNGGITASDGGWVAQFSGDPAGERQKRYHLFRVVGDKVYDIWYDMTLVDLTEGMALMDAVTLPTADPVELPDGPAEQAFAKVQSVYQAVQDDASSQILVEETGETGDGYRGMYYFHQGSWMELRQSLPQTSDNVQARLLMEDHFFTGEGLWDELQTITWSPAALPDTLPEPHLTSFLWNKAFVTYLTTQETDTEVCYRFQINKLFRDTEGAKPGYLGDYIFDKEGRFLRVVYRENIGQENAYSVTESLVSLDPQTVGSAIADAYRQASGN